MKMRFTERMRGFYCPGAPSYDTGHLTGRAEGIRLDFSLTIGTPDLRAMLEDPIHHMPVHGVINAKEFGPTPLPVTGGCFDIFAPTRPGRRAIRYRLPFRSHDGTPMTLLGHKDIGDDHGPDLWPDTTTLYLRLLHGTADWPHPGGPDTAAREYGRGILTLTAPMFARQLSTFRGNPLAIGRFGMFFAGHLYRIYRGPSRRYRR